jgi:hypothetical protein
MKGESHAHKLTHRDHLIGAVFAQPARNSLIFQVEHAEAFSQEMNALLADCHMVRSVEDLKIR